MATKRNPMAKAVRTPKFRPRQTKNVKKYDRERLKREAAAAKREEQKGD